MSFWLTTWHENAQHLVGAPLVGALGGHKGRPYGILVAAKNLRSIRIKQLQGSFVASGSSG